MNIPFGKPIIGKEEKKAVEKVLSGTILVHGPIAEKFEEDFKSYTKAPYAVSVSSCTAGMHLIYFTLGLGPGDEVIVPAQTHIATAHSVELTGAKPIFIDSDAITGNIDLNKIENAINHNTKVIAVVHYLGVPVDMQKINLIAKKYNLFVLEDCALSPGATLDDIHTGLHGDAGVFSFYPVKHFTTAEGGMIISKDENLVKSLRLRKAFGVDRNHGERKIPGMYDTIGLGFNYRMSEIHAAIGVEQLKKLDSFLQIRKSNYEKLAERLRNNGINVVPALNDSRHKSSYYCLSIILNDKTFLKRHEVMDQLTKRGIGSSIYYPQPVPRMKYYREKYKYDSSMYVNASKFSDRSIALPIGPHVTKNQIEYISKELINILNEFNK